MARNQRKVATACVLLQSHTGVSLIEVLVALLIMSLGLVGLTSLFSHSFHTKRFAHDMTIATLLGQEVLNQLLASPQPLPLLQPENTPTLHSFTDAKGETIFPQFRWQVETERDQQGRATIRVHIYWPWPKNHHHLDFATYAQTP